MELLIEATNKFEAVQGLCLPIYACGDTYAKTCGCWGQCGCEEPYWSEPCYD